MSYLLTCPNCGVREVTDFSYGGEITARPKERPSWRELNEYNYFRDNVAGVGCDSKHGYQAWQIIMLSTTW